MWGQIEKSLGKNRVTADKAHHAACPYRDVATALRGAAWSEVNLQDRIWTIPGSRMKAKKEHRVPLSDRSRQILALAKELTGTGDLIFCHPTTGKSFSDAVFTSLIHKGLGLPYTMHGFRSSFRDWGSEKTSHARELLEVSLAHIKGDGTEMAYWRGDVIERRFALMQDWAAYATTVHECRLDIPNLFRRTM